jgi:RNA polymerase sigma factor (sigma-70 family)
VTEDKNTDPLQATIQLVRAAQSGKSTAMDALFERYLPRVRQIVALRLGDPLRDAALHDDLVQESLLRVFQNLDKFEERSDSTFQNWISQCVTNSVNEHFRRQAAPMASRRNSNTC